MKALLAIRNWLDAAPVERDGVSWIVSCAVHLTLLITLALLWQQLPVHNAPPMLSSLDATDLAPVIKDAEYISSDSDAESEELGSNSFEGSAATALATAPTLAEVSAISARDVPTSDFGPSIDLPVMVELSTGSNLNEHIAVRGDAGVGTTGAEGAIDLLTQEILQSLEQRPTLVVWLIDQSESLRPQRAAIEKRLDHVYEELRAVEAQGQGGFSKYGAHPLLTAVMAFGEKVEVVTKDPIDDVAEIKKALHDVPFDESGVEMTFTAVGEAAKRYRKFRSLSPRRNVLFIIVTDEAGNDEQQLDSSLELCKRNEMPVYVIGVPAPFGQRQAFMRWEDPEQKYRPEELPVDQGPESARLENVQLGFAGRDWNPHNAIDSGFGPFGLTRLCVETGGRYIAVHPNRPKGSGDVKGTTALSSRISYFFDPSVMYNYRPDYVSARQYDQLLKENKARAALVEAASMSMVDPMERPRLVFPKRDEANLKQELDVAQRSAAIVAPKLARLYAVLKDGEKDRPKLTGTRWQAGYDLAMGRVLANAVRTDAYNTMLAKAKNGMKFEKENSDTWVLQPTDDVKVTSALEKMAASAREYLTRVVEQHPGTPWAYLAERELADPLGWKWSERHTGVNEPRRNNRPNNNPNRPPPQDRLRMLDKPKPERPNLKL